MPSGEYGSFFAFILPNNSIDDDCVQITNRCYIGYSKDKEFYSFVHGNEIAKFVKFDNDSRSTTELFNAIRDHSKTTYYKIQKQFSNFDYNEFLFYNPTNKLTLKFIIHNEKFVIQPNETYKFNIQQTDPTLTIKSNYFWPRPIVFSYKNKYFDVHHA